MGNPMLQALADPQQLARLKAMAALFGQQQQPAKIADETPTAPPPAPTLSGSTAAPQPAPGTPGPSQPATTAQPAPQPTKPPSLATPGAISGAMQPQPPDVVNRFREWEQSEPKAPNPADYKGGIMRRLAGAGAGAAVGALTRNPQEGAGVARQVAYPGLSAAQNLYGQAEQRWKTQGAGLTEEEKLRNFESEISDRESQAQERKAKAEGEQVVPFKLPSGEEIQVRRQDIPRMETAFNPRTVAKDAIVEDPANPGQPKYAKQQADGTYIDPDTQKVITGARPWEKPSNQSIEQAYSAAVSAAMAKGQDPSKDPKVQQIAKAYRELHPQNEPGSYIPTYDPKSGALTGAWDPKNNRWHNAPGQMGTSTTGAGLNAADKREQAAEKEIRPLQQALGEVEMAHTLKDQGDSGNAEADVGLALTFFKVMRGAQGGSNIRFTQQENNLIMGARSLWGTLETKGNKVLSNGEPLSRTQRQQMLEVIDSFGKATQRQIDQINAGHGGGGAAPAANAPAAAPANPKDPAGIF